MPEALTKLLILESDWRSDPVLPPTQPRSAARLYRAATRSDCLAWCCPLDVLTWAERIQQFTQLAVNRRGPNVIIFSTHGRIHHTNALIAANNGLLAPLHDLPVLRPWLRRSIVIFDVCDVGRDVISLRVAGDTLGIVGFAGSVEWTASTAWMLALLRAFNTVKLWQMRRVSAIRPRNLLDAMQHNEYQMLMSNLGVRFCFRGE